LCILSIISGTLIDDNATISFFEDFLIHVRFLFVIPFLILIEQIVDKSFIGYIKTSDELIPHSQQTNFNQLVKRLDKLTDSYIPGIVILNCIVYIYHCPVGYLCTIGIRQKLLIFKGTHDLNIAGWYYILVCSSNLN